MACKEFFFRGYYPIQLSALMVQCLRDHASEPNEFEPHSCHLVQAYGRQYVQVRPVRPKISHFKNNKKIYVKEKIDKGILSNIELSGI